MSSNNSEVFKEINVRCAKNGISISQLCRDLNINRHKIQRWKTDPPQSVVDYHNIKQYFDKLEKDAEPK
jgi:hypothetical protein